MKERSFPGEGEQLLETLENRAESQLWPRWGFFELVRDKLASLTVISTWPGCRRLLGCQRTQIKQRATIVHVIFTLICLFYFLAVK